MSCKVLTAKLNPHTTTTNDDDDNNDDRLVAYVVFALCFTTSLFTLLTRVQDLETRHPGHIRARMGRIRNRLGLGASQATSFDDRAVTSREDDERGSDDESSTEGGITRFSDGEGGEVDGEGGDIDGDNDGRDADGDGEGEDGELDEFRPKPKPFNQFATELLNATVPIVLTRRALRSREWFTCGGTHVVKFKRYGELRQVTHLSDVLPHADPFALDERMMRRSGALNLDAAGRPHVFKTCAVVGNSGSLLETQYGPDIDAAEVVIRFNNAVTEGFEQFVGWRTSFRIVNTVDARFTKSDPRRSGSPSSRSPDETTIFTVRTWDVIRDYVRASYNRSMSLGPYVMADPEFLCHVHDWVQRKGEKPSSGLVGIVLALRSCASVKVYGFAYNTYFSRNSRPHYYDWERPKKGREKVHPFRGEVRLYKDLKREGFVDLFGPD